MNNIITGAAAGILGDKTGEALYGKGHLEESHNQECLHADIHAIRDCLEHLAGRSRKAIFDRTVLQPGILIPMDIFDRDYNVALVSVNTPVQFEVVGLGQAFTLLLAPGWNTLNMPEGTRWGLPASAKSNVSVLFCATDDLFGNAVIPFEASVSPEQAIFGGQAFSANYVQVIGAAAQGFYALSLFNPATSGKNFYVFSAKAAQNYGITNTSLFLTLTDPALGTPITPLDMKTGGPSSVANVTTGGPISFPSGESLEQFPVIDVIDNAYGYLVTPGNGIEVLCFCANSQEYALGLKWFEV